MVVIDMDLLLQVDYMLGLVELGILLVELDILLVGAGILLVELGIFQFVVMDTYFAQMQVGCLAL